VEKGGCVKGKIAKLLQKVEEGKEKGGQGNDTERVTREGDRVFKGEISGTLSISQKF